MPRKMNIEKYKERVNSKMSMTEIQAEYTKLKANPEANEEQLEVLETALYECNARKELPEQFAWELLKGSKMLATIIGFPPNKRFRKILLRAKLLGGEFKIVGYVQIRSPYASRYQIGASVYVELTPEFRQCYHALEEEKTIS